MLRLPISPSAHLAVFPACRYFKVAWLFLNHYYSVLSAGGSVTASFPHSHLSILTWPKSLFSSGKNNF